MSEPKTSPNNQPFAEPLTPVQPTDNLPREDTPPPQVVSEGARAYLDSMSKLFEIRVDLFKHLATLSSGSIVILATFGTKIARGSPKAALICALIGLGLTILSSAWACFYTLGLMMSAKNLAAGLESFDQFVLVNKGAVLGIIPLASFVFSFIAFVVFMLQQI